VALNDVIMVVAFAPLVGLLLGLSAITVPWDAAAVGRALHRRAGDHRAGRAPGVLAGGGGRAERLLRGSAAVAGRAAGDAGAAVRLSGRADHGAALVIALLAVPILIQVYFNSGLAYLLNRWSGERIAWPAPRR
jgi:ACR3 family arsenite transporter